MQTCTIKSSKKMQRTRFPELAQNSKNPQIVLEMFLGSWQTYGSKNKNRTQLAMQKISWSGPKLLLKLINTLLKAKKTRCRPITAQLIRQDKRIVTFQLYWVTDRLSIWQQAIRLTIIWMLCNCLWSWLRRLVWRRKMGFGSNWNFCCWKNII